jgi:hypothetical protein
VTGHRFIVVDDTVAANTVRALAHIGEGTAIKTKEELRNFIAKGFTADVALVDMRWNTDDGSFDGVDALEMLQESRACPRALIFTEGGAFGYRHWIEEANLLPIVSGAVQKTPDDLDDIVRRTIAGRREWHLMTRPRPTILVDILGQDKFTAAGRIIRAMLSGVTGYPPIASFLSITVQRVKNTVPEICDSLAALGEPLTTGHPQSVLAEWVGTNKPYLLAWARRVGERDVR